MPPFPHQAIVLAAGLGTRLKPLTDKVPKPMLPMGGVPILLFNLFLLKEAGIRTITINLHHRPEEIRKLLKKSKRLGLKLHFSLEPKILGTAGGIAQALSRMKKTSTFILNGDILFDLDLGAMVQTHRASGAKATLACVPKNLAPVTRFVEFDRSGKIYRIAGNPKKMTSPKELTKAIFSGAHLLEPELFADYPLHTFGCIIRQIYQPFLAQGGNLQAYYHQDAWFDLGSIGELKRVDRTLWEETAPRKILDLWKEVGRWAKPIYSTALSCAPASR